MDPLPEIPDTLAADCKRGPPFPAKTEAVMEWFRKNTEQPMEWGTARALATLQKANEEKDSHPIQSESATSDLG